MASSKLLPLLVGSAFAALLGLAVYNCFFGRKKKTGTGDKKNKKRHGHLNKGSAPKSAAVSIGNSDNEHEDLASLPGSHPRTPPQEGASSLAGDSVSESKSNVSVLPPSGCLCYLDRPGHPQPDDAFSFQLTDRLKVPETLTDGIFEPILARDLTPPIRDGITSVTPQSQRPILLRNKQSFLVPLLPVLEAMEYADKHSTIIERLSQDIDFVAAAEETK